MTRRSRAYVGAAVAMVLAVSGCAASHDPNAAKAPRATAPASAHAHPTPSPTGLSVVGLGDSVVTGYHCACAGPLVTYAATISHRVGRRVRAVNDGVNGGTTSSLLAQLRQEDVRADVRRATAIVMIVGANDLDPQRDRFREQGCDYSCFHGAVTAMGERLSAVLRAIAQIRSGRRGSVLVADYWNVFLDGDRAISQHGSAEVLWGRRVSRDANVAICHATKESGGICVDTYRAFLAHGGDPSRYLAADGDHPDGAGADLIAARLAAATPASLF